MRLHKTITALSILAVAACDQDPVAPPVAELDAPVAYGEALARQEAQSQYVFLTKGSPRADLLAGIVDAGGEVVFSHDIGFVFARGLPGDAADALAGFRNVTSVEEDIWIARDEPSFGATFSADAGIASPDAPAEAGLFGLQWNMRAINVEPAWDAGRTGSSDVTVAILDTGVDPAHPDLLGRVDLTRSISFVGIDDDDAVENFPGRPIWTDLHFHGTHVAATAVSNSFIAAGVTSKPTIMAVRVCTWTTFTCSFGAVVSGILHAVDNGADVANLSLGGEFSKAGNGQFVGFINRLFNYARRNGTTMVVAAGNAASDLDRNGNIFASYCDAPGVICVSATGPTAGGPSPFGPFENVDAPASYTNFGRSAITVAAPGGNSVAPGGVGGVWAACTTTSLLLPLFGIDCSAGFSVLSVQGTSMASPHVAGLAALVVEDVGRRPGRVKTLIQQNADDLGQRGTDKFYGKGRINVARTLGIGSSGPGNGRGRGRR